MGKINKSLVADKTNSMEDSHPTILEFYTTNKNGEQSRKHFEFYIQFGVNLVLS